MTIEEAFSPDGYITDQDAFEALRYRTIPASINGCGPIAAYNLRHFLGQEAPWRQIFAELDAMHRLRVPGPTLMTVMRRYLNEHIPGLRETVGREEALAAAAQSRAGIFRYREKNEPHFVSYVRAEGELFRFFNVADGLEDCRMTLEQFGAEHLCGGTVIVFTVA